jgi:sterol desaturase/sphingolipid hydroxylase (fatty acid hydroxylase superfamily)
MFAATWGTFLAAACISFAVQVRRAAQGASLLAFLQYAFPVASWRQRTARMDVILYLITKVTNRLLSPQAFCATVVFSAVIGLLRGGFPDHAALRPSFAILLAFAVVAFVVVDFANYLTHCMQHFVPVLWELHKVHHSATFLSPVTNERHHPLGNAFDGAVSGLLVGVPTGVFGFLFGLSIPDLLLLLASANTIGTILVLDALRHSQFPVSFGRLDRVLLSPHMHQLHHGCRPEHCDRNFGNKLSVWDWAFGTVYRPARDERIPYGLGKPEEGEYNRIVGACVGPLLKIGRLFGQARGERERLGEGILWRHRTERRPRFGSAAARTASCVDAGRAKAP